ncbi:arylsulfatase [Lacticaseibacillus mingshuiensis]|uniref:Arylsulfatase n=1 Tax=Lacticaseibacillus mingshuiensis TaxID=2799574 RepID=A0ABW4CHK7_9LACO|nr:arylsulfatase [Lacticaseibacillus mingshuiensis]
MKPNVILIVVDQMRAEALALNEATHFASTPTLDSMAASGVNFQNMYSATPTCVPARASLLTGLDADHTGRVGYQDRVPWDYAQTLPQAFRDRGYQTECVGKMHVYPPRARLGYDHVLLHDGYLHVQRKYGQAYGAQFENGDDYLAFLKGELGTGADLTDDGIGCNSWEARPWPYAEQLHPTNWVVSESIKFLQRRDPTVPFFLKMSFEKPHAPLDPPAYYFDIYMDRLPAKLDLHLGDWEAPTGGVPDIEAMDGTLKDDDERRMVAAYLGLVTQIDHQLSRFMTALGEFDALGDTLIWFVSDHGDQLGEHRLFRKGYPYQGSIHVPSFLYNAGGLLAGARRTVPELVLLQDIFPSLVDLASGDAVAGVDGRSVKPLLFGENVDWRQTFHGEHALGADSSQFIVGPRWKLIWFPVRDVFQLFDRDADPDERHDLSRDPAAQKIFADYHAQLVTALTGREEGFVQDGQLVQVPVENIHAVLGQTGQ